MDQCLLCASNFPPFWIAVLTVVILLLFHVHISLEELDNLLFSVIDFQMKIKSMWILYENYCT